MFSFFKKQKRYQLYDFNALIEIDGQIMIFHTKKNRWFFHCDIGKYIENRLNDIATIREIKAAIPVSENEIVAKAKEAKEDLFSKRLREINKVKPKGFNSKSREPVEAINESEILNSTNDILDTVNAIRESDSKSDCSKLDTSNSSNCDSSPSSSSD